MSDIAKKTKALIDANACATFSQTSYIKREY